MICVYDIGNENFDRNGDAVLQPQSGRVRQVAGGSYEITITHAIDPDGKWQHLAPGAIVKAPVPMETIDNAYSGYDADVYKTTTDTGLKESTTEPTAISYNEWVLGTNYTKGDLVTRTVIDKNYRAKVDIENILTTVYPESSSNIWEEIPRYTSGAATIVSLPAGSELYFVEDVDTTWYKMSTYYGVEGYIKKSEVTFDRHLSPTETTAHVITEQLFRLREPTIDNDNQTVTVTGMHVSYDLNGVLIQDVKLSQESPQNALAKIVDGFMIPYRGTIATNMTADDNGTYTGEIKGRNGMFALIDPDTGIVPRFGAKFTRDNWDLFVMQQTDTDRGFRIRYGKNARGITWRRSSANLVTRVVPVAKGEDGSDLYLPEMWIDSPLISAYPVILMERLSVKGQVGKAKGDDQAGTWTESDLLDEMRAKAEERFTVDHADEIVQEVTVQFEQLGDTAEYAGLKELETVLLYDTVTAEDPRIGLQRQLYVSELEFDIIRKKVVGVKLSNVAEIMRSVTGYNVQNNSISSVKLTDEAKQEIITEAQDGVEEIAKGAEIVVIDSLTSTSGTSALSANQGKVLKGLIDKLLDTKDATNLNDITETCITYATSTTQNAPTSSCFVLTMVRSTGATVQFALRAASNAAYYRRKSSGTWDGWQKFTISAV